MYSNLSPAVVDGVEGSNSTLPVGLEANEPITKSLELVNVNLALVSVTSVTATDTPFERIAGTITELFQTLDL